MIEALPVLAVLVAVASGYATALRRVWRRRGRRVVGPYRVVCFALGLVVICAALTGPLDDAADERFSLHMVQHAMLVLVAAPLLVVGTPITVLVLALSADQRRRTTTPLLRSRVARWAFSAPVALATFVVVLWMSHLPPIYDAAAASRGPHDVEHLAYLFSAVLFWMSVFGLDLGPARLSYPGRLLYLFLAMAAMAVLGTALAMSPHPLYGYYVAAARAGRFSALADQHTGGVIMWTAGMVTVVPVMVAVVLAWLAEDERRTVRLEQQQQLHHAS